MTEGLGNIKKEIEEAILGLFRDELDSYDSSRIYNSLDVKSVMGFIQSKLDSGRPFVGLRTQKLSFQILDTEGLMYNIAIDIDVLIACPYIKEDQLPDIDRGSDVIIPEVINTVLLNKQAIQDNPPRVISVVSVDDLFQQDGIDAQMVRFRLEGITLEVTE